MCNLKLQHISKHNKKEADTGLEKKLVVTSKWERSDRGVGEWEAQTIECKMGSRMYCTTLGIWSIFCNNYKWKVTFQNCIKIAKQNKMFLNNCFSAVHRARLHIPAFFVICCTHVTKI